MSLYFIVALLLSSIELYHFYFAPMQRLINSLCYLNKVLVPYQSLNRLYKGMICLAVVATH